MKKLNIQSNRTFLFVFFLLITTAGYAQNPLPDTAFRKMIIDDITYAIVGENTPVTGIKVDISKPEGTISGMFLTKKKWVPWDIFGFELKGGVTDKNFSFIKGVNSANSAFEFRPSFHWITQRNNASYGRPPENVPGLKILFAKNDLAVADENRLIDTFYVVTALYNHHLEILNEVKTPPEKIAAPTLNHKKIAAYLISKILNTPNLTIDPNDNFDAIIALLPKAIEDSTNYIKAGTFKKEVVELYKKYKKLYDGRGKATLDRMIVNSSEIWTQKSYFWLTVSPFIRTEKVNEYYNTYEGRDSSYFKSDYRWYYGVSLFANKYWVNPNKLAILLRGSFSVAHSNNLSTLTAYNYETRRPFFQYGSVVTEKSKIGSAYNNTDVKMGFEKQLGVELYILPLNSFVPGLYVSANVSQSNLYKLPSVIGRADDRYKAAAEGGLIFNINNRDKDKTILSITTYFRYEDLTDSRRTSVSTGIQESRDDFNQRNISMGVKVGIPITLPKRSN